MDSNRDILQLNVIAGSSEPLICTHKSIRDAELREVADYLRATAILLEIILILTSIK